MSTVTKQTSHLAVLQHDRVVLIEVMEADNVASVRQAPGDWAPLYCTAVGKVILGFLSKAERNRLINQITFRELTPTTLTTPELLMAELQTVTAQGVAFDNCEDKDQCKHPGIPP